MIGRESMKKLLIVIPVLLFVALLFLFRRDDEIDALQFTHYEKTFIENLFQVTLPEKITVRRKELNLDFSRRAVRIVENVLEDESDLLPEEVHREIRDYSSITINLELVVDQNCVDEMFSSYTNVDKWAEDFSYTSLPESIDWKAQDIDYYYDKPGFATKNIVLSNGDVYKLKTVRTYFAVFSKPKRGKVTVFMSTYFTECDYSNLIE